MAPIDVAPVQTTNELFIPLPVIVPEPEPAHTPFMAKQPAVIFQPLSAVDVAEPNNAPLHFAVVVPTKYLLFVSGITLLKRFERGAARTYLPNMKLAKTISMILNMVFIILYKEKLSFEK